MSTSGDPHSPWGSTECDGSANSNYQLSEEDLQSLKLITLSLNEEDSRKIYDALCASEEAKEILQENNGSSPNGAWETSAAVDVVNGDANRMAVRLRARHIPH